MQRRWKSTFKGIKVSAKDKALNEIRDAILQVTFDVCVSVPWHESDGTYTAPNGVTLVRSKEPAKFQEKAILTFLIHGRSGVIHTFEDTNYLRSDVVAAAKSLSVIVDAMSFGSLEYAIERACIAATHDRGIFYISLLRQPPLIGKMEWGL